MSETRATRLQLAQAEVDREAQLDAMAGLAVDGQQAESENAPGGAVRGQEKGGVDTGEKDKEEGEAAVLVGGSGGGVEMVALQVRWEGEAVSAPSKHLSPVLVSSIGGSLFIQSGPMSI